VALDRIGKGKYHLGAEVVRALPDLFVPGSRARLDGLKHVVRAAARCPPLRQATRPDSRPAHRNLGSALSCARR